MRVKQSFIKRFVPAFTWEEHGTLMQCFDINSKYYVNVVTKEQKQCYAIDAVQYQRYWTRCLEFTVPLNDELQALASNQEMIAKEFDDQRIRLLHMNAADCYRKRMRRTRK